MCRRLWTIRAGCPSLTARRRSGFRRSCWVLSENNRRYAQAQVRSRCHRAFVKPRAYPARNGIGLPVIIISDVEPRYGLRRNDIGGRIADIEAGDFQIGRLKMLGAASSDDCDK